jgi:hypothetical protein
MVTQPAAPLCTVLNMGRSLATELGRPWELRWMRRAVFGEPLRAHPPEIGWVDAPGNTRLVEDQRDTGCDENCDGDQHDLDAAGTPTVIASIVPDRAARVCAVMHICIRSETPRDNGSPG